MKQLFDKFKPQDMVPLIDKNQLKQHIGLQTLESNPQSLFEQTAALENQFKKRIDDSEKIAITIEKLPVEYQPVLTVEMRKEGALLTAQHIENTAFSTLAVSAWFIYKQYCDQWSYQEKTKGKSWLLQHSMEPATDVVVRATKKLNVMRIGRN